jgi:hypothetical protein
MPSPIETCMGRDGRSETRATEVVSWSYFENQRNKRNLASNPPIIEESTAIGSDFEMGKKMMTLEEPSFNTSDPCSKENTTHLTLQET